MKKFSTTILGEIKKDIPIYLLDKKIKITKENSHLVIYLTIRSKEIENYSHQLRSFSDKIYNGSFDSYNSKSRKNLESLFGNMANSLYHFKKFILKGDLENTKFYRLVIELNNAEVSTDQVKKYYSDHKADFIGQKGDIQSINRELLQMMYRLQSAIRNLKTLIDEFKAEGQPLLC